MLSEGYYKSVARAGGSPVIVPPIDDEDIIEATLDGLDALVLTGGGDFNPLLCGEEPSPLLHGINAERDRPEMMITRAAYRRNMPVLGICRGMQTLAMALGGHVRQDIGSTTVKHSQDARRTEATHTVTLADGSLLQALYKGRERLAVNSLHHQAVDDGGPLFRLTAHAADATAEAMESTQQRPVLGVQWHPEWLDEGMPLFRWLVDEARLYSHACRLHDSIVTFDSHCDTPMLFAEGATIMGGSRQLVSVPLMEAGRLDAVTMVAYLPQPPKDTPFTLGPSPKAYADSIFDRIESDIRANGGRVSLAKTEADIRRNKRQGRRSVVLGIENGLALEHDIRNIEHFARRGVSYITLCHNGDNEICDSARGTNTNGGVSDFGREVIQEMNRLGVLVDLSHAAESSFYDAIDISRQPVVCSHSCCRALCDVPRNLSDEQLRALADNDGIAQITLYAGFLNPRATEATIRDALAHLDHAISIMGTDHVGIGTDLDGDGGVPGFADASDALNFTIHLLRQRYSDDDIERIWGGNWLRRLPQQPL